MKSNNLTNCDFSKIVGRVKQVPLQKWKETFFLIDLSHTCAVASSAYPRDLTTPFPSSSRTFPRPSAAPPEPPPTTWRSPAICGSSSSHLLTASPPHCSLPQAWQTWKNSTPAANPPRETKRCLETLFLKRPR